MSLTTTLSHTSFQEDIQFAAVIKSGLQQLVNIFCLIVESLIVLACVSIMLRKLLGGKKGEIDKSSNKLPKHVEINHYTICFKPYLDELSFEACVAVDMTVFK